MSKQSPFYKTGISRSPLNTHKPGHSPEMIKSKPPIDPERTKVTYDKKKVKVNTKSDNKKHKKIKIL